MSIPLPEYLTGRYRQYKIDTERIAAWLAFTAERCGFTQNSALDSKVKADPKIAKTRKQKKRAEAARSGQNTQKAEPRHRIKLKDFALLADFIAAFDRPPVEVPASLFSTFTRAIGARKRCASWFQKQANNDDAVQESNRMHSHFIGVLEKTLLALRPRCPPDTAKNPLMNAAENHALSSGAPIPSELNNIFEALELEEPSEAMQEQFSLPRDSPPPVKAAKGSNEQYEVEFEAEDLEQEMFFAAYCLFADLNHIRAFIQDLWSKYDRGTLDLITVSVTTNTAIELANRSQADFDEKFELDSAQDTSALVQQLGGLVNEYKPWQRLKRGDEANFSMPEVHDFFFLTPLFILEAYTRVLSDSHLPVFNPETFGKYNPDLKWSQLHPRQQFQQDKVLLLEYLPDFTALQHFNIPIQAKDAVSVALRQFVKKKSLPIHTLFAAQILLDIHRILGPKVRYGLKELQGGAAQIKATVVKNQKFHEDLKVPTWNKQNEQIVETFVKEIDETVFADFVGTLSDCAHEASSRLSPNEPFHWFSGHPLFCGLRLFSLRLRIQEIGVLFIGAWGTWWLAHLYNAARQMHSTRLGGQILDVEWPDMDILIDMQGESRVFVGLAPTTIDESWARLNLVMGYSAGALAKKSSRRGGFQESARGPRGLSITAPVSRIFADWLNKDRRVDAAVYQVEEFFKLAAAKDVLPADKQSTAKILKRMAEKTVLTPIQLLRYLQASIKSEVSELFFDYLDFHRRCWELLRNIDRKIQSDLIQIAGPDYMENEYQLPWVVPWIFSLILGTQFKDRVPTGRNGDRTKNIGLRDRSILIKVTAVLKDFIEKEGSVQKNKLKSICGCDIEYAPLVPASLTNGVTEEYARNMHQINKGYEMMMLGAS